MDRRAALKFLLVLSALLIILLLVLYLRSESFQGMVRSVVVRELERSLESKIEVSEIEFDLLPPAIYLKRLFVSRKKGGAVFDLRIPELEVHVSPLKSLGKLHLSGVTLRKPVLVLKGEEKGETERDRSKRSKRSKDKGDRKGVEKGGPNLPLRFVSMDFLQVIDGEFSISFPHKGVNIEGSRINIRVSGKSNLWNGTFSGAPLSILSKGESYLLDRIEGRLSTNLRVLRLYNLEAASGDSLLKGKGEIRFPVKGGFKGASYYSRFYLRIGELPLRRLKDLPVKIAGTLELTGGITGEGYNPKIEAVLRGKDVAINQFRAGDIEGGLETDLSTLNLKGFKVRVGDGFAELDADIPLKGEGGFKGSLSLKGLELAEILENLTIEGSHVMLLTSGRMNFLGRWKPFHIYGEIDLKEKGLRVLERGFRKAGKGDAIFSMGEAMVKGKIEIDSKRVRILKAEVYGKRSLARVNGYVGFDETLGLNIDSPSLWLPEISPIAGIEMAGNGRMRGTIGGPFSSIRIKGDLEVEDYRVIDYYPGNIRGRVSFEKNSILSFSDLRGEKGGSPYSGDLTFDFGDTILVSASVRFEDSPLGRLSGIFPPLSPLKMEGSLSGEAVVKGPFTRPTGRFEGFIRGGSIFGRPFEEADISLNLGDDSLEVERFRLKTGGGGEIAIGGAIGRDGVMDLSALGEGLEIGEITQLGKAGIPLEGRLSLKAGLGGDPGNLMPEGEFRIEGLKSRGEIYGDGEIHIKSSGDYLDVKGRIREGEITFDGGVLREGRFPFILRARSRNVNLHPLLHPFLPPSLDLSINYTGDLLLEGKLKELSSTLTELKGEKVVLSVKGTRFFNTSPLDVSMRNKNIYIEPVRFVHGEASISVGGVVDSREGIYLSGEGSIPLNPLKNLVEGVFTTIDGEIETKFNIAGARADDIKFHGIGEIRNGAVSLKAFPPKIEKVSGGIEFSQSGVRISELAGTLGGGRVYGDGVILFRNLKPWRYDLSVNAEGVNMKFPDYLPLYNAGGDLKFTGQVPDLLLSGDITINRWIYTERINWKREALSIGGERLHGISIRTEEESPPPLFDIDIRVHAPKGKTVMIKNNMADIELSGELEITGDTNRVGVKGEVFSDEGEIVFHGNKYKITTASVTFDDPSSFDPLLDISLYGDIDDYRVYSDITGRISNYQARLSSDDPTLTEADLSSLVLFGTPLSSLGEEDEAGGMGLEAANLFLEKFFSIEEKFAGRLDRLPGWARIDRFQITSSYSDLSSAMALKIMAEKEMVEDRLFATGYTNITGTPGEDSRIVLEYKVSRGLSLLSSWETEEDYRELGIGDFGIDFKFKLEME